MSKANEETSQVGRLVMCKDCKDWDKNRTYNAITTELEGQYGNCKNDAFAYEDIAGSRTDMLIYADHEGVSAGFDTGANFGCIHGTKRT